MFNIEDCYLTGTFIKTHGIKGELVLKKENDILESYSEESVLVDIDGGLVPFFISTEGINSHSKTTIRMKLNDVNSEESSLRFVNCNVYVLKKDVPSFEDSDDLDMNLLIGYTVFDEKDGEVGEIENVLDYSGNVLFQIFVDEKEILIPFVEDNILNIDEEGKNITIVTPEGLLDANFN